jgi:hypothetical protein
MDQAEGGRLLLQIKAAGHSVIDPRGPGHNGQRVAAAAARAAHRSRFEGWTDLSGAAAYVRVFKQNEVDFDLPEDAAGLSHWACLCGAALARFHVLDRVQDQAATQRLIGAAEDAADEVVDFAAAYADMVEADRAALETIVG